jgi:hypothetical protein
MNVTGTDITIPSSLEKHEFRCPFSDITGLCNASISSLMLTARQKATLCYTEDYDDCPIFLSKILRIRSPQKVKDLL